MIKKKSSHYLYPPKGLVIVDEAHLAINPSDILGTITNQGYVLNWTIGLKFMQRIKLLLATATPMADENRPLDVIKLLNLVKFPNEPNLFSEGIWRTPIGTTDQERPNFQVLIKKTNKMEKEAMQKYLQNNDMYIVYAGLVSYFTLQYDLRVYPKVIDICPSLEENESTQLIRNDCQTLIQAKKHCALLYTGTTFNCIENKDYVSQSNKLRFVPIQLKNPPKTLVTSKSEKKRKVDVLPRWKILTSFIALTKQNQHHYIYSETYRYDSFFETIHKSKTEYEKFKWYTIENALEDITQIDFSKQSTEKGEEGMILLDKFNALTSDEQKTQFLVDQLYVQNENKSKDKNVFVKREKMSSIILFAPSDAISRFTAKLNDRKYLDWFAKYMKQPKVDAKAVKSFIFTILLGLFNHKNNINAEYFNIFAGDKSAREGLSLNLLNNVYFLKVPTKMSTFIQVVGRGTRWCNFREEKNILDWRVRAYLLFYNSEDIENYQKLLSAQKDIMFDTLEFLKIISLDCYLFGPYIHAPTEEYTCGTKTNGVKKIAQLTEVGGTKETTEKEKGKKITEPTAICIDQDRGFMFEVTEKRLCPKSLPIVPHYYNEIDAFAEQYILSKLIVKKEIPELIKQQKMSQENAETLRAYLRNMPTIYFSKYDTIPNNIQNTIDTKTSASFLLEMLPYLYCQVLTVFRYSSLYHLLETLPLSHLKGWLRLILLKKVQFSKEQNEQAKLLMNEAYNRLELFNYQNRAAQHLIHLKKFFSEYPTVIESKKENNKEVKIGLRQVEKELITTPELIEMEEEPKLTGQKELDFLLTEQNLKTTTTIIPQIPITKHGIILSDEYSKQ